MTAATDATAWEHCGCDCGCTNLAPPTQDECDECEHETHADDDPEDE